MKHGYLHVFRMAVHCFNYAKKGKHFPQKKSIVLQFKLKDIENNAPKTVRITVNFASVGAFQHEWNLLLYLKVG